MKIYRSKNGGCKMWAEIFQYKWAQERREQLEKVKKALEAGTLVRENEKKKLTQKEFLDLVRQLNEKERQEKIEYLLRNKPDNYFLVNTERLLKRLCELCLQEEEISLDIETSPQPGGAKEDALDPWKGVIVGISLGLPRANKYFYIPVGHSSGLQLSLKTVVDALKNINRCLIMHNAPFDAKFLYLNGLDVIDLISYDSLLAAKVLNENDDHGLKSLCSRYLKMETTDYEDLFGPVPFREIPIDVALVYAAKDAEMTIRLAEFQREHLALRPKLARLFYEIEMPVMCEMIKADLTGSAFDVEECAKLDKELGQEQSKIEAEIKVMIGDVNINSPAQLSRVLYDELKLIDISGKRSTGVKVLKKLSNKHDVIPKILEYRAIAKLRQAFTQKLPNELKKDGRIHPWHNTYGAHTGRFSCNNPNTQQLPAKDERSRRVRQLFVADSGRIFISIDYSQIELRLLAHFSQDENMMRAYREGIDIHAITASKVFGLPIEKILDDEQNGGSKERKKAKNVNFGISYLITAKGLADQIGCSDEEAQKIIEDYFRNFPKVKQFIENTIETTRRRGYAETILGRKRRLHKPIRSSDYSERASAERQAVNFVIQGSAADLLKKAIVDLQPVLKKHDTYIRFQVHDELIFDAPENISREALEEIMETMRNAIKIDVPIEVDAEIYPHRWAEGVKIDEWFDNRSS